MNNKERARELVRFILQGMSPQGSVVAYYEKTSTKYLDAAEARGRTQAIKDCIAALGAKGHSAGSLYILCALLDDTPAGEGE